MRQSVAISREGPWKYSSTRFANSSRLPAYKCQSFCARAGARVPLVVQIDRSTTRMHCKTLCSRTRIDLITMCTQYNTNALPNPKPYLGKPYFQSSTFYNANALQHPMPSHVRNPNYNEHALQCECIAKPETLTWKTLLSNFNVLQRECIAKTRAIARA